MTFARLLRLFAIPTLAFAWVVLQYVQLDGERTVRWRPGERSPFVQSPLPADRVERQEESFRLNGDPVYVHVTPPPGRWKKVTVTADIAANNQPVLEFGVVANARTGAGDLRPAYNALLASLGSDWVREEQGNTLTFTRQGTVPTRATTRTYRAPSPTYPEQNWSTGAARTLPVSLQSGHEWWTYGQAGDELIWSAEVVDQNIVDGPDELALILQTESGEEVARLPLPDATDATPRPMALRATLPTTGPYRIVLSSTSDITWRNIVTNATHLVAKNQLRFAEGTTTDVWAMVAVVGIENELAKYPMGLGEGTHRLTQLAPNTSLVGEGWFALSSADLWSPTLTPLTTATNLTTINRIIATKPSFTQTFDFAALQREQNGSFRLTFSLPGVAALPAEERPELRGLTITFTK